MILIKKSEKLGYNLTYLVLVTICELLSCYNIIKSAYLLIIFGGLNGNAIHIDSFKISMSIAFMFLLISIIMSTSLFSEEFKDRELNCYLIVTSNKTIRFELDARLKGTHLEYLIWEIILRINNVNIK